MRHHRLSLEDLELVHAIGAHGSLTGAARALALDHSSAFRRLAAIEARLEGTLFRRSRRGYAPTESGELVIAGAGRILADSERLQRALEGRDTRVEGRIRITIPDTLTGIAAAMCAAFTRKHPGIRCDLIVGNRFFDLQQPDAEVALRASVSPPDGLSATRIGTIATAAYAPAGEAGASWDGPWIGFDDSLGHLSSAHWLRTHVADADIAMRVNSLPAALAACRAGIGRALLPRYLADPAPEVTRLSPPLPEIRTDLWFAIHADLRRIARIRLLRGFVRDWFPSRLDGG
ncbi:LysR family transcriptional regulator [Luteimonas salinilitoris]|uniref:LysR family transcriptional regulator n=1 Tax=Luteimonas salinilitoris TaxID=3237697 RepID=A0ABV4HT41_9GAMM